MISEEKMSHIIHLMLDGLEKGALVSFKDKELAIREGRKICNLYLSNLNGATDAAKQRIVSQKNPPQEGTQQWDNLYQKYLEEELQKRGGWRYLVDSLKPF